MSNSKSDAVTKQTKEMLQGMYNMKAENASKKTFL